MNVNENAVSGNFILEEPTAPRRTRLQEFWRLFKRNRLAILGLAFFVLFFCTALAGLFLTSGQNPVFDPAQIRLQEKLRPPLSMANLESLQPDEVPVVLLTPKMAARPDRFLDSLRDRRPRSRPSRSTTGRRRAPVERMNASASSNEPLTARERTAPVIAFRTYISARDEPSWPAAMAMSRSLSMPRTRSDPSSVTTGRHPTSSR